MYIHTFLAYPLVSDEFVFHDSTVVLIDVLRASTTICHALHNGAREVIPLGELEHAVRLARTMSSETTLLCGERKGLKPHGFTLGNSPLEYTAETVQHKSVIFTTSNGTQALAKVRQARCQLVGAFVNIAALVAYIQAQVAAKHTERVFLLCAGNNGDFSYEDMLCAGAIARHLVDADSTAEISDATTTALAVYDHTKPLLAEAITASQHAQYLASIGFGQDIEAALAINSCPIVPLLEGSSFKAA